MSGVKNFLHVASFGADGFDGIECHADKVPTNGSFINWLFGWDASHGFPSVTGKQIFDDFNQENMWGNLKCRNVN